MAQSKRARAITWIASGAVLAMVATVAVIASGYDAREAPREEPAVWAMRTEAGQYARVNTLTGEIDTVRQVDNPSGIVQAGAHGALLTQGGGRAWNIDPAQPRDLLGEAKQDGGSAQGEGAADPAGTTDPADAGSPGGEAAAPLRLPEGVQEDPAVAGDAVLFRTEKGEVFLSRFGAESDGEPVRLEQPQQLDPFAGEQAESEDPEGSDEAEQKRFIADAVALDADGNAAMFSAESHEVRWYSLERGDFTAVDPVPDQASGDRAQLAIVAGSWVIFDPASGRIWREGASEPVETAIDENGRLQASSTRGAGTEALVADGAGLWRLRGGAVERVAEASGTPAQPIALGADRYAAWLGGSGAQMWSSADGTRSLDADPGKKLPGEPEPAFRTSGTNAMLTEVKTGVMWRVPDGRLIPASQWDALQPKQQREGTVVKEVTEQEPPVAVDDAFGVRAGEPTQLPVLLNDYDPNKKDVLTIDPDGLGEDLPRGFGTLSLLPDGQSLVIHPAPDAKGTATIDYRITDGSTMSKPATIKLTVVDAGTNTAPQWCDTAVEGCQREWPSPELAPGGTLVLPVLEGWVDPEGDPMVLESARVANAGDGAQAIVTADGRLAVRHPDPNAADGEVTVRLRVADSHGKRTDKDLAVQIRRNARAELSPVARTVRVDEPAVLNPLSRITGGSGSYALVDASVQSGSARVAANAGSGAIEVRAKRPGTTLVTVTARDTGTDAEIIGTLRITAVESRPELGLPPLRAFVRPLADTTIDVLAAIPSADGRALAVQSARVVDGQLRADVVEHAKLRVSGSTSDGAPGRIGAVDVTIAEGGRTTTGRVTVFQVPESGQAGAIAVGDSATVRAGAVVDIAVLENDVASPGQRLVLDPAISGSGAKGELAFASGNVLRYLAPAKPGVYTIGYTAYGASSPEEKGRGTVTVTVLARDGKNREPQPVPLTVRLAPGERSTVTVPLSGVDPDGDRVRLTGVSAPSDPQLTATIAPRTAAVVVEASERAEPGVHRLEYRVSDALGGEGAGQLQVVITEADPSAGAPITYSDYVRLETGAKDPAVVRPLDNDIDPSDGALKLLKVVPNLPSGSEGSAEYRAQTDRLDLSQLEQGRVSIRGAGQPGTISYRYTVRSDKSKSTADGLIVVQVSARVGHQAPAVKDTVLSARDRFELGRGGVDVVTGRVSWASGDVDALQLSVWGAAKDRFSVEGGTRITGDYRAEGDVVPFRLSGKDLTGAEAQTFGFLVIPPLDELRLTLKPGFSGLKVDENETVNAALADVIDLAPGDTAEFKTGKYPTQRGQASCTATGSTSLRYSAGREAPWVDSCVVSVKLVEQTVWTQLPVPVQIVPDDPVAELEPLTRTVSPGASETIDLTDMVRWQGDRAGKTGDLRFQVSGGGGSFEVKPQGAQVVATARADAVPGSQDALTVTVTGAGESRAQLTLRVGEAQKAKPRGATVQLSCQVGASCHAQLVGVSGEFDPYAGKAGGGLKLESVDGGGCSYGTLQASGDGVSVSWPQGKGGPGGRCTASFTVRDAQKGLGSGTIEFDARGVPRVPTSITVESFTGSSVTLAVTPSGEDSHPSVEGVKVRGDGGESSCSRNGGQYRCTVTKLRNGEKHAFTAVAFNAVGDSAPSSAVTAWAYEAPPEPTVEVKQVSAESPDHGTAKFTITGGDGTRGFRLETAVGTQQLTGRNATVAVAGLPTGANDYRVTPLSEYEPPPGAKAEGATVEGSLKIGGLPTIEVSASSAPGSTDVTVTVKMNSHGGGKPQVGYSANKGSCSESQEKELGEFLCPAPKKKYKTITVSAWAKNEWGDAAASTDVLVGGTVPDIVVNSGYTIDPAFSAFGSTYSYKKIGGEPSLSGQLADTELEYTIGGVKKSAPLVGKTVELGAEVTVRQCYQPGGFGSRVCSANATVVPPAGSPATTVKFLGGCYAGTSSAELAELFEIAGRPASDASFAVSGANIVLSWTSGSAWNQISVAASPCTPPPDPEPGSP